MTEIRADQPGSSEPSPPSLKKLRSTLGHLAKKARREGLLSLRDDLDGVAHPALRRGLEMVVDGVPPDRILEAYREDIVALAQNGEDGARAKAQKAQKARGDRLCATALGVVALQQGYRPRVVRKLLAGFGA